LSIDSTYQDWLLTRLLDLARQEQSSPCVRVRARKSYVLSAVNIDTALLAIPLQGSKRVRTEDEWIQIVPGAMFVAPHAQTLDIANIPDPLGGYYIAISIPLDENVLGAARQLLRTDITRKRGSIASIPIGEHAEDLNAWLEAMQRNDLPRACHALVGVVLRLYSQGHRGLLHVPPPTLSMRIRTMVASDPARVWASADLEEAFGMSGATLRRHLAAEKLSLREIIGDARLSHGLTLLSTTRLPVKTVASRVGYASVSSFTKRFSERYGVEPSRVSQESEL
jgi:AraC-like DNA-binding protein